MEWNQCALVESHWLLLFWSLSNWPTNGSRNKLNEQQQPKREYLVEYEGIFPFFVRFRKINPPYYCSYIDCHPKIEGKRKKQKIQPATEKRQTNQKPLCKRLPIDVSFWNFNPLHGECRVSVHRLKRLKYFVCGSLLSTHTQKPCFLNLYRWVWWVRFTEALYRFAPKIGL